MEEYRIDVKVRNNTLLYKLERAGYKSIGEFCRIHNVMKYSSALGKIAAMKRSPLKSTGEFYSCIKLVAEKIGCDPLDLFSDTQLHTILKTNKRSIAVNEAEMKFMIESCDAKQKLLYEIVHDDERSQVIDVQLATLSSREQKVINLRFGLNGEDEHTLEETGIVFDITRERVRQIEAKALRKLRHKSRATILKEYI